MVFGVTCAGRRSNSGRVPGFVLGAEVVAAAAESPLGRAEWKLRDRVDGGRAAGLEDEASSAGKQH